MSADMSFTADTSHSRALPGSQNHCFYDLSEEEEGRNRRRKGKGKREREGSKEGKDEKEG